MEDVLTGLVDEARELGASYSETRFQDMTSAGVTIENGLLRAYESDRLKGVEARGPSEQYLGILFLRRGRVPATKEERAASQQYTCLEPGSTTAPIAGNM